MVSRVIGTTSNLFCTLLPLEPYTTTKMDSSSPSSTPRDAPSENIDTDIPLDVSEDEPELTENEVDLLMDALDDGEEPSNGEELGSIEPLSYDNGDGEGSANNIMQSRYSFSLPADDETEENAEEDRESEEEQNSEDPVEDGATEPASVSDEPAIAPSSHPLLDKTRKRVKVEEESNLGKSPRLDQANMKKDEWDEERAVSHLFLSPYDSSFGLLSRVDTK